MRRLALLPLLLLLFGASTGAEAAEPRPLDEARRAFTEAQAERSRLRAEQLELGKQVGALSQRITALKAEGRRANAATLDAALKESQALSAKLGTVTRQEATAKAKLEVTRSTLLDALAREMEPLQRAAMGADAPQRQELLTRLQSLRTEAEGLRGALPRSPLALLPPLPELPAPNTHPERLLAQIDALKDQEDRVQARLKDVRARIKVARAESRLARGMDAFVGRRSLFDEQDRRLDTVGPLSSGGTPSSGETPPEFAQDPTVGGGSEGGERGPTFIGKDDGSRGSAIDAAALTGQRGGPAFGGDPSSVEALEALATQLEAHARELSARATTLERQLEQLR